jgi:hypothetical protein
MNELRLLELGGVDVERGSEVEVEGLLNFILQSQNLTS